jgi:transcription elongation factor GreA
LPRVAERIAAARAEGDLSENAEYHGQREAQGLLLAKVNQLKTKLSMATIVDRASVPRDRVGLGATVTVLDLEIQEQEVITLVGAGEEDYDNGRFLINSPIGQGLLGKRVEEVAAIQVPRGTIHYKILDIQYPDQV